MRYCILSRSRTLQSVMSGLAIVALFLQGSLLFRDMREFSVTTFQLHEEVATVPTSLKNKQYAKMTEGRVKRQFPHEGDTSDTSNHTHYMDLWGMNVINNYKSTTPINVQSDSITLVSQMSIDDTRMQRLLDLASCWSGYISMALYFWPKAPGEASNTTSVEKAMSIVDEIRAQHSVALRKVNFHIVVNAKRDDLIYPTNVLRNVAMSNAVTDFVLLLDVDFIPAPGSHDLLMMRFKTTPELMNDELVLLVLPAFERNQTGKDSEVSFTAGDLPASKGALVEQMKQNPFLFDQFHNKKCEACHGPTNYSVWYVAKEPYPVTHDMKYEPYFVVRVSPALPPFWEHFTGYGRDKVSWVEEMALGGFHFLVSPDTFVIHINHDYSKQQKRAIRPLILDEFVYHFQPYLKRMYGRTFWESEYLASWHKSLTRNYVRETYRLCRSQTVSLGDRQELKMKNFCKGEGYENFMDSLIRVVVKIPEPLGRRAFPMAANATFLAIGNSQTQQTITTLVCQFKDQVVDYYDALLVRLNYSMDAADSSFQVRFRNNSTLVSLIDNPVMHSPHWDSVIENLLGLPLRSFDGIILGAINTVKSTVGDMTVNLTFGEAANSSFLTTPTLSEIVRKYSGPMVFVSSFAMGKRDFEESHQVVSKAITHTGTCGNTISVIDGQKYVEMLKMECATDVYSSCIEENITPKMLDMHLCVGKIGGNPDLMAWEVAEKLHTISACRKYTSDGLKSFLR
jgi:Glycosyl-transferase for dystroglycan